jgi:hypothetical protein
MKKIFLSYSAIIEGLTGFGLIFAPSTVAAVLFRTDLNNASAKLFAMVAGAAICYLALDAWLIRSVGSSSTVIKLLVFYNAAVAFVLLYGIMVLGFGGFVLWAVIIFHLIQSVIALRISYKR